MARKRRNRNSTMSERRTSAKQNRSVTSNNNSPQLHRSTLARRALKVRRDAGRKNEMYALGKAWSMTGFGGEPPKKRRAQRSHVSALDKRKEFIQNRELLNKRRKLTRNAYTAAGKWFCSERPNSSAAAKASHGSGSSRGKSEKDKKDAREKRNDFFTRWCNEWTEAKNMTTTKTFVRGRRRLK